MHTVGLRQQGSLKSAVYVDRSRAYVTRGVTSPEAVPDWVEWAYYLLTVYAIFCQVWGISVRMVGFVVFAMLAMVCVQHLGSRSVAFRQAVMLPMLCALSLVAVQILVHGESLRSDFVVTFVTWMVSLVVLQSLALRRGFLHRFALLCFAIGLMTIPYMRIVHSDGVSRVALDRAVSFANPNDLGAWFGFCCVYFIIVGIETRRLTVRLASLVAATTTLVLLGLTVSRGPMIAVAIAAVIALRRTLKRGFIPLLMIVVGFGLAYGFGVFDQMLGYYVARGTTESGRTAVWPLMLKRIYDAPLVGVGISDVATYVPIQDAWITPHNSYLFFPLSSGILPTALFLAYLARAVSSTLFHQRHSALREDQPFRLPLLVYVLVSCLSLDYPFMAQWAVACLCVAMIRVSATGRSHAWQSYADRHPRQPAGQDVKPPRPRVHDQVAGGWMPADR